MQVGIRHTTTECSMSQSPGPMATLNFDDAALDRGSPQQPAQPQQLLSLWDWYNQQQGWSLSQPALPTVGSFAWPAELQTNSSLQADTCSLSGNLIPDLGSLADQDRCILAFQSRQGSPSGPDDMRGSTGQPQGSPAVYLRLMLDLNTGKGLHRRSGCMTLDA